MGTIAGIDEDDVVFGARQGRVQFGALVALSLKEPSDVLSEELWGAADWPYAYFLYQAQFGATPTPEFLRRIGEHGNVIQGFRISYKASELLRSHGSPAAFIAGMLGMNVSGTSEATTRPVHADAPPAELSVVGVKPHQEAQADLIRIGRALGLDVWVASNDRSETVRDLVFRDHTIDELPFKGQPEFHRRIELIDVLRLQGPAILAAFEVEHSTGVASGLLRMGDLVAQFPYLSFPLYIVAPDADRRLVCREMSRPAFRAVAAISRYLPYSRLRDAVTDVARFGRHLAPTVIGEYTDLCSDEESRAIR